jgi:hypothetical protein
MPKNLPDTSRKGKKERGKRKGIKEKGKKKRKAKEGFAKERGPRTALVVGRPTPGWT